MVRYTPYVFEDGSIIIVPDYIKDDIDFRLESFVKDKPHVNQPALFSIMLTHYSKTGSLISL